jgi:putative PEP-CTERM system TPR-repeat lipoprotein
MHHALRTALRRSSAAALLVLAATAAVAADSKASQFYEDALKRFEEKDNKGAIVQLKNAIKLDRKMLQGHVLLGRALLANGEVNAAEAAFDEALKLGVNPAEVVLPLAETVTAQGKIGLLLDQARFATAGLAPEVQASLLLLKAAAASDLGRPREAIKFLEDARALNVNTAESWTAEVPIRVRARQMPEAKAAADKAVALDPKSHRAAYQRASVAHVSGDLKQAIELYTRALALKPEYTDALVARAGIYIDTGKIDLAEADVNAARKADPRDPRAAYLSALLTERKGDAAATKKALAEVTNLLDPLPLEYIRFRPQVLMLGGMSHYGLGQYEKAKPYLEMLLRQEPNHPVSKLLANIYVRDRKLDQAVQALETYLRNNPNDQQAVLQLASTNYMLGRNTRAVQLAEEGLKKHDDPSLRALLGMSMVGAGRYAPAAAELEATLKQDPKQLPAGISLVNLYVASGQGANAVRVAELLVKQQPNSAGVANLMGTAQLTRGDMKAARAAFERALKLDPALGEAQLNLARLDISQGQEASAQTRLNALLTKDEKNVDALMETARLFSLRGKPDEALKWLTRAEDHSGNRLQPGLQMIDFQLAQGRPDRAREALKRLQAKAPEALVVLLSQARVQLANNELAEAKATLNRTTTQVSYDAAALTQVADLQVRAGNLPGAAYALDKALQAQPNHLRARVMRSNVHLLQGEGAKAEALAKSVIASDPKSGLGYSLMGDIARSRGQTAAAVDAYRRAFALDNSTESLLGLFQALDVGQHAAAVTQAQQWLRDHPSDLRVLRALADSRARTGELAAAKTSYENLLKLTPQDAEVMNNLAIVLIGLKDPAATKVADAALALKPQTPYIIGTAGWAAFHAGQHERALQLLRDARLRDPANASTRYFLAAALAQQGRKGEARQELEAALKEGAGFAYAKDADALLKTLN